MQTKFTIITLLLAAVNAAPSLIPRAESVPITVYRDDDCDPLSTPLTVSNVPTDGSCWSISPIVPGNTDSFRIEADEYTVPAGCNITVFTDTTCSSVNFINIREEGQCFTFGPGLLIRSAIASGTC